MRKLLFIFILCIVIFKTNAQVPEKFNYQAVIRDNAGELITEQNVGIKLSILDKTATGTVLYSETHTVSTNAFGQVTLKVGSGAVAFGTFNGINWASGDKYLKVELDATGGTSYTALGEVQLLSVPYALFANDVTNKDDADANPTNEIQDLNLTSNILTITNNPSATAINLAAYQGTNTDEQILSLSGTDLSISGGNTIDVSSLKDDADNSPTNELQNLTLDGDTLEITNGNSIIFPYDSSRWALNGNDMYYNTGKVGIGVSAPNSKLEVMADASFSDNDTLFAVKDKNGNVVFAVFPDGAKVYVNEGAKGTVGGFAVSGRGTGKASEENYMVITSDSARIYINDAIGTKGKVGGFAVSGRGTGKSDEENYMVITSDSARIYINDTIGTKGKVGGFAVSGRGTGKAGSNNIFLATVDSTRIYVNEGGAKGSVGGFAVSGRGTGKGITNDYFNISANAAAEIINNESRVMWYPEKSAFLAGELYIPDPDSVGEFSLSLGYRNSAIGDWSQAMGYQSIARGPYSTAIGFEAVADTNSFAFGTGTKALGYNSFAFGSVGLDSLGNTTSSYTIASGDYSFAFGLGSEAIGTGSFVLGTNCDASGDFSTAAGFENEAIGFGSTAMGGENIAGGHYSLAFGYSNDAQGYASVAFGLGNTAEGLQAFVAGRGNTVAGVGSVALGTSNTITGDGSFAAGNLNECSQSYSMAFGNNNTANGTSATAFGAGNTATGNSSVAAGSATNALGDFSLVIGSGSSSTANGDAAFAAGYDNIASGQASVVSGYSTEASGNYSTAFGYQNAAPAYASFVIGQYTESTSANSSTSWNSSDPVFVVGNGTGGVPSENIGPYNDAFVIYKNGDAKIEGNFYPNVDDDYDLGTSGRHWRDIYATNNVINTSDKRLKTNINDINYGLNEVLKLRPVTFLWKDNPGKGTRLGLIAQETQLIISEVVNVGDDENKTLGLRYTELIPVLIKSIQEQQQIIDKQAKKNEDLENQLKEINEKLLLLEQKIK